MLLSNGLSSLQIRYSHLLLTALFFIVLLHATGPYRQRSALTVDVEDDTPIGDMLAEHEYLERLTETYRLGNYTRWHAWRIQSSEQSIETNPTTDVHSKFQPHWDAPRLINLNDPIASDLRATKRMELPIQASSLRDKQLGTGFLFGVSTTYDRVVDNNRAILRGWKRWLTTSDGSANGAGMVLMLDRATKSQLNEIEKVLHESGIDAYVTSTAERTSKTRRYYELVRVLKTYGATLAASGQAKQWYGVVEDTIFFPSLSHLRERLSPFDIEKQQYIGIPSERLDWEQTGQSVTTYGGGAIMMTKEAVGALPKLPCLETQRNAKSFRSQKWDALIRGCVKHWLGIDMQVIPAFYSPYDEQYSPNVEVYETGTRPLLLHDSQGRHRLDVGMAHLVADVCGDECFMHRYVFHDNWVVINGVSISHYPGGLVPQSHRHHYDQAQEDIAEMKTSVSGQIVVNDEGVTREPLKWSGHREVWKLLDTSREKNGSIWQAYLKKGRKGEVLEDGSVSEEIDSIIVLIWEPRGRAQK